MVRVLADRAADRPDKDWIVFDSRDRLTFGGAWAEACRAGHAFDRDLSAGAHVGLLMRNQPEFLVAFYGTLVRGGMAVPLNADSRGPLLHAVIEHSDIEAIVVRDELVERLTTLTDLAHVRLVIVVGDGPAPDEIHGVPRRALRRLARGPADRPRVAVSAGRRARRDHVHVRHDGPAEGRRLHAPVPLPLRVARV